MNDDVRRYKIICYLATGCSNKEAAEQSGVSLSTIERLKRDADFKAELYEASHSIYRNGLLRLTLGIDKAASELLRIIESSDTPDRVKLKAIEILFSQASHLDSLALEERLNRLEEQVKRQEQVRFLHPVQFVQSLDEDEEIEDNG
jgi:hypothetical protein